MQLTSAFEKNKLVEVSPVVGEKLDPMKHQAVSTVAAEQEPIRLLQCCKKGYTISDRPAATGLVTVAH